MKINSQLLRQYRDQHHWSQEEFAEASGLSLRTVQRAENSSTASLRSVRAMASAFGIDANQLKYTQAVDAEHSPKRHWLRISLFATSSALILISILVLGLNCWPDPELPVAQQILGEWQGRDETGQFEITITPTGIRSRGSRFGVTSYTLVEDTITLRLRGQGLVSSRIEIIGPDRMAWRRLDKDITLVLQRKAGSSRRQ